jgi:competence protein ComEC
MVRIKKCELPSLYAALGAAAIYYSYPLLDKSGIKYSILSSFFICLIICICLLRILNTYPFPKLGEIPRVLKKSRIFFIAAASGCVLGYAARLLSPSPPSFGLVPEKVLGIQGALVEDPRLFNDRLGIGKVKLQAVSGARELRASASGLLTVFFPAEAIPSLKEFGRGCVLYTEGKIIVSRDGAFLFRADSLHIIKPASSIEQIRTTVRAGLLSVFGANGEREAPGYGALASALLLGVRDNLDGDLAAGFRDSGLSHVLALSGMHLALISGLFAAVFKRAAGFRASSILGIFFIILYVFLAGGQPSLVRASIMFVLGQVCLMGYIKRDPFNLLCIAFIIQIIFQREAGTSLSFILSYLALAGILTLGGIIHSLLRGRIPELIGGSLSASLGAFIITAPVVSLYFGQLRPIGIISGLFVVPLASFFMVVSLAFLALGRLLTVFFKPLDFALYGLYVIIEKIIGLSGKAPGIAFNGPVIAFLVFLFISILLIAGNVIDKKHRGRIAAFDN